MKFYYKFLLIVLFAGTFASCENFVGGDINADPNRPISVPVSAQMPFIQIAMADVTGGAFSRFNSMLVQQVEGVARQWSSFNQYTGLTPNRFDSAWNNTYENILNEIKAARESSQADGNNHTLGVLNVMEAYTLMQATDVWDDLPYSEAFQGIENISPNFDSQADIYGIINSRLTDALSLFAGAQGPVAPGGDVIYGDPSMFPDQIGQWTKTATALRARAKVRAKDYAGAASDATAYSSASDNFAFQYPDANAAGGWYRFNRDRTGDIELHPNMRNLMTGLNDTMRLAKIDYPFVVPTPPTEPGHPYMIAAFDQELVTYREMQFIIAEADVMANNGGTQAGLDAYLEGIRASFDRYGAAGYSDYISQSDVNPGVGNLTLDMVMTQKYIAMFLQPENYTDWRRTGIPALTPTQGNAIPVRWDYSSQEYLFNANLMEGSVNFYNDKVGWDD